jgi:hypothetical protein
LVRGAQIEFVQKLFRKIAPSLAILSMLGVWLMRDP